MIYGWGRTKEKDFGKTFATHCRNCDNDVFYHLKRIKKYFTILFIPAFPYEKHHYLLCPICGSGIELESKETVSKAKDAQEITQKYLDNELNDEQYQEELDETGLLTDLTSE